MKKEDLIKKLEKTRLPQIEIPSHKKRLKMILMDWKYKKDEGLFAGLRKLSIPLGAAVAVLIIALIISNLIFPQYSLAEVREIAMENPQIKEWLEKGAEIKDIEIVKSKAYVLIIPEQEIKGDFRGAMAEIEIKEKTVSEIKEVIPQVVLLDQKEKNRAVEILKVLEFSEGRSEDIKIEDIKPIPPSYRLELIKKDSKVEFLQEEKEGDKKAKVFYEIEDEKREGTVNLIKEEIEKIEISEENKGLEKK